MLQINSFVNNYFDSKSKFGFYYLLFLMFVATLLELVGISLVIPIINSFLGQTTNFNSIFSRFFENFSFLSSFKIYDLILIFFILFALKFIFLIFFYYQESQFVFSFKQKLSDNLFKNYLNKDYETISKNSAVLINNITNEVDLVTNYLNSVLKLILDSIITISLFIFLIFYNFTVTIITFIFLIFFALIYVLFFRKKLKIWGETRFDASVKRIQFVNEGIKGNKTIKIFNSENLFFSKFFQFNKIFKNISVKITFLQNVPRASLEFLGLIIVCLLILFSFKYSMNTNSTIEIIGVFLFAFFKIVPSLNRIIGNLQQMRFYTISVETLKKEQTNENVIQYEKLDHNFKFQKEISIKIKNFKYETDRDLLFTDLNFKINKNEKLGIIGPSGSGKSSLLDIIVGLVKLKKDSVFIDNQPINHNLKNWQKKVGYVNQKTFLMEDTLKNNILFGSKQNFTEEHLKEVIENSNLSHLLKTLPNGLDTIIKEDGKNLSGGEIQRIGIARALFIKSEILILDEATSALDIQNEEEILSEILKIKKLTVLCVTHRKNSLKNFDKILQINNKKIEETI